MLIKNYISLIILFASISNLYCQEITSNYQRNFYAVGVKISLPFPDGTLEPFESELSGRKKLALLSHNIDKSYELNYGYRKRYTSLTIDATDVELGIRSSSGNIIYKKLEGNSGNGYHYEDRIDLDFKNIFIGSTIKFEKELDKKGSFVFIFGADVFLRVFNKQEYTQQFYKVDYNSSPTFTELDYNPGRFSDDLIPVQSSLKLGFTKRAMILGKLVSLEMLGSLSVLNLHNAGFLKTNSLSFAIRQEIN